MIPDWLRKLGNYAPNYGSCCGRKLDCSGGGNPIDGMDCACVMHDMDLYSAHQIEDEEERLLAIRAADLLFGLRLRNKDEMEPYKFRVYGPIYNAVSKLVFK